MPGNSVRYAVLRDRRNWDGVTLSGLTAATDGTLVLTRAPGVAASGSLTAGPIDAGELSDWERVHATVNSGDGTVSLALYTSDVPTPPAPGAWTLSRAASNLPDGGRS